MRSILQPCKLLNGAIPAQVAIAIASAVAPLQCIASSHRRQKVKGVLCVWAGGGVRVCVCVRVDCVENNVQGSSTSVCNVFFH